VVRDSMSPLRILNCFVFVFYAQADIVGDR
jgi:hypothetical protein